MAIAGLSALGWGGLKWSKQRAIASALGRYGFTPNDLTEEQRNLLADTFNARFNPWALRLYVGKVRPSSTLFDFPYAWEILARLYYIRTPNEGRVKALKRYLLYGA